MATDRSPIAYLWPTLKAFATGDVITRELLRDSINKAGDIGYGVLAALNERFQQLGSTNAGTSAVQRGSVVMGGLSFYDPVDVPTGSLDGLTLILQTDLAGPVTITFAQPTSPVHVATQINTQGASLGLVASCDSGIDPNTGAVVAANVGKLLLVRPSGASADLIVKGAGTANAILGLPLVDTTVSGTGMANDGASRIGVAAFSGWSGGTLRAICQTIFAETNATFKVNGGTLADADYSITSGQITGRHVCFKIPSMTGNRVYTLPSSIPDGVTVSFRMAGNGTNYATIKRPDTTTVAVLDGVYRYEPGGVFPTAFTAWYSFAELTTLGGAWVVTNATLTDPQSPAALVI